MNLQKENGIGWCDLTANPMRGKCPNLEKCRAVGVKCYANAIHQRFYGQDEIIYNPNWYDAKQIRSFIKKNDHSPYIFVGSMIDLFADEIPEYQIREIISQCKVHTECWFIFCTQNPKRYIEFNFPSNCYLLTTVRNQPEADERIPLLLQNKATVLGVSIEPMLGEINFRNKLLPLVEGARGEPETIVENGIDWVIVGGETGPGARPMHPDWVKSILNQCNSAGVPFFFKGWGGRKLRIKHEKLKNYESHFIDGKEYREFPIPF
jgi:protein gp37